MCLKKLFKRKEKNVPPDTPEPIPPIVIPDTMKIILCKQSNNRANPTCHPNVYHKEILRTEYDSYPVCDVDHSLESSFPCESPVVAGHPLVGHCVGLETLSWKAGKNGIDGGLWVDLFQTMAENSINFHEFFLSCREDQFYNKNTICPVTKNSAGKFDVLSLNPDFVRVVGDRLDFLDSIKFTSSVCIFSGVKNVRNDDGTTRWSLHYMNGHRNVNHTTSDVNRFMDDQHTIDVQQNHIKMLIDEFDSPYRIWRLINEPQAYSASRLHSWYNQMILFMVSEGIPRNRIACDMFDSSLAQTILNQGCWLGAHAVGSPETVKLWNDSPEREPWFHQKRFYLSNDGGDDPKVNNSQGLRGKLWDPKFRMPSSEQMGDMHRRALKLGGRGMNTMSAAPYLSGPVPDFEKMISVGLFGITEKEIRQLAIILEIPLNIEANMKPEFLSIKEGVKWGLRLKEQNMRING